MKKMKGGREKKEHQNATSSLELIHNRLDEKLDMMIYT